MSKPAPVQRSAHFLCPADGLQPARRPHARRGAWPSLAAQPPTHGYLAVWGMGAMLLIVAVAPAAWAKEAKPQVEASQATADDETAEIARLIQQLGHVDYFQRQRAQQVLATYGAAAFDALVAAQNHPDIEIASRAKYLLHKIDLTWDRSSDDPDVQRVLKGYGDSTEETRLSRARQLALLPCNIAAGPLARIVRYEPSELLSRRAALLIIHQKAYSPLNDQRRRAAILEQLGPSERTAAQWLRTFVLAGEAPSEAVEQWQRYIDQAKAELKRSHNSPIERQIAQGLTQYQAELLTQLGRAEQARPLFDQVVEWTPDSLDALLSLSRWLIEQGALGAFDTLERTHRDFLTAQPLLLYAVAEARALEGNDEQAEKLVKQARTLVGGDSFQQLRIAYFLGKQGFVRSSERELRHVMEMVPPTHRDALNARMLLSERLHDRGAHLEAAKLLQESITAMEQNEKQGQADQNGGREVPSVRSRMYYFFARHYEDEPAKQVKYLEQAIAADAADADALIALYRRSNKTPEEAAKVSEMIRTAVIGFRKQIEQNPDREATPYNQLAWLVGNTEGDYQEAVKASLKSLEIQPGSAAYLDTLGRAYFAAGDLENAIKHQIMAVEREPYSDQMRRQLAEFLEAQEAKAKP